MVCNILRKGVQCVFVRQSEQLGLGHAILCARSAISQEPFAVLLADNFINDYKKGITIDLVDAFFNSVKSQLSVVEVSGPEISKYGVLIPTKNLGGVEGLIEKSRYQDYPPNLASIGRYVLTPDIFDIL